MRWFCAVALGICLACDAAVEVSGSPAGPQTEGQFSAHWWISESSPVVLGIVVDDVDDAQGEEARAQLLTDLQDALEGMLRDNSSRLLDPGRFEPIDVRIALAFPSYLEDSDEPQPLRFVSWTDEPELRWHEDYRHAEDIDRLVDRVRQVAQDNVQPAADTYRPIEGLHALTRRLYATFCASFSEPGVFDDVPVIEANAPLDGYGIHLAVLTGRDDVDTPLGLSWDNLNYIEDLHANGYVGCYPSYHASATTSAGDIVRLTALVHEMEDSGVPIYPYNLQGSNNPLWLTGGEGRYPHCNASPYGQDIDGSWLCKHEVLTDTESCDESRGWRNPVNAAGERVATFETPEGQTLPVRVCEIDQLKGAARERCETDFECQDCTPGWCIPTLPELRPNECSVATTPLWQFRFVGPSNPIHGMHRISCME